MMEKPLKERLLGAAILIALAVIFIPILLSGPIKSNAIDETNIPAQPPRNLSADLMPLTELPKPLAPGVTLADTDTETNSDNNKTAKQLGLSAWVVQLGSFSNQDYANQLSNKLKQQGFAAFTAPAPTAENDKPQYRVRVGPELRRSDAEQLLKAIETKFQLKGFVASYP